MPSYTYRAKNKKGKTQRGVIESESERAAVQRLRQQGLMVMSIHKGRRKTKSSANGASGDGSSAKDFSWKEIQLFKPKVKLKDIMVFSRQFATMISAGLGISACLNILAEQSANPTLREVIEEIRNDVESGVALNEAFAKHSKIFPDLYINMVRAGESSGALESVLDQLAIFLEKQQRLRGQVKSAMFMPSMILGFAILMSFGLVTFVVPRFGAMFLEMGKELPAPTQALLNLSKGIRSPTGILAFLIIGFAVVGLKQFIKTSKGRMLWDQLKLKMPIFGEITVKAAVARFSRTLVLLLHGGVPILESIAIVGNTSGNMVIARSMQHVRARLSDGEGIAGPLSEIKEFPPMVTQMIAAGEETGAMEAMLSKLADFYEEEVERAAEQLTSMVEPVMVVLIGLIVGGIMICLYLPVFDMAGGV